MAAEDQMHDLSLRRSHLLTMVQDFYLHKKEYHVDDEERGPHLVSTKRGAVVSGCSFRYRRTHPMAEASEDLKDDLSTIRTLLAMEGKLQCGDRIEMEYEGDVPVTRRVPHSRSPYALQFASERLRNSHEVILQAVALNGDYELVILLGGTFQ